MSLLLAPRYSIDVVAPGGVAFGDVTVEGTYRAHFIIQNDGFYSQRADFVLTPLGAWISPQAGMNLYQCRATAIDLNPPPGTYNTWLDLAQSWSWGWNLAPRQYIQGVDVLNRDGARFFLDQPIDSYYEPVSGTSGTFLLEIARKSDGVVVDSGNVTVIVDGDV